MVARWAMPASNRASRPSPSWASRLLLPTRCRRNLPKAYASSLVPRAPPRPATAVRRFFDDQRRQPLGDQVERFGPGGLFQDSPSALRINGVPRGGPRCPGTRSRTGPCRTASPGWWRPLSTPMNRSTSFWLDCTEMRQPTEQCGQVLSTASQVPGAGPEAVGGGGEGPHRTDLHGVAREVGGERLVGERVHLGGVAPVLELDQRIAGDLVGEPGAAGAQDAALPVEQDQVGDRDRLGDSAASLRRIRLSPGPYAMVWSCSGHSPPLSHTGQSSGWLSEQELEDAFLGLLDGVASRCARPCRRRPASCRRW